MLNNEAERIRIFIGESDKHENRPLFEVIVEKAKMSGLAGATVLRGLMGFGANSQVHYASILRLSESLPLVIEIVDEPEKLDGFIKEISPHDKRRTDDQGKGGRDFLPPQQLFNLTDD